MAREGHKCMGQEGVEMEWGGCEEGVVKGWGEDGEAAAPPIWAENLLFFGQIWLFLDTPVIKNFRQKCLAANLKWFWTCTYG